MISINIRNYNYKILQYLLCFTCALFIYRTLIPFLKFPLFFLLLLLMFSSFAINWGKNSMKLYKFISDFKFVIIQVFIFLVSIIFSNKLYLPSIIDFLNVIILLLLFFTLFSIVIDKTEFKSLLNIFIISIIILSIIFSLIEIFYLLDVIPYEKIPILNKIYKIIMNDINGIDPNFTLLPFFFSYIGLLFLIYFNSKKYLRYTLSLLLFIVTIKLFITGSRRGLIMLGIIITALILSQLFLFIKSYKSLNKFSLKIRFYLFVFISFISFSVYFIFYSSYNFRNKTLEFLGSKNIVLTKDRITLKLNKYESFTNYEYYELYDKLWTSRFNPIDPDCGWGTRSHKSVYPLAGKKVEIVPKNTKGYYMDSTCEADTWEGHAFSFTSLKPNKVTTNDLIVASVYCYVSDDFNGTWARLIFHGAVNGDQWGNFNYDFNKIGTWQKIATSVKCKNGIIVPYLYFSKIGVKNFSTLKGHVIFAYPLVKVLTESDSTSTTIPNIESKYLNLNCNIIYKDSFLSLYKIKEMIKKYDIFLTKNSINKFNNNSLFINYFLPIYIIRLKGFSDKSYIKDVISNYLSQDTTYYSYESNLIVDSISNRFTDPRIVRWKFALEIWTKEYNWPQKIFGGGFNFLNWYGYVFLKDKKATDYPHNPFLYILLYSGIVGVILYIMLLYRVVWIYWRYRKEYPLFFIFFLITYYFTFFSGGNPFDPPVMGFFMMLPFLIHAVHKREEKEKLTEIEPAEPIN
jgi:hypothetical protein